MNRYIYLTKFSNSFLYIYCSRSIYVKKKKKKKKVGLVVVELVKKIINIKNNIKWK